MKIMNKRKCDFELFVVLETLRNQQLKNFLAFFINYSKENWYNACKVFALGL